MARRASAERNTKETQIIVDVDLDGSGAGEISTQIPFFDHMLDQISKHGRIDLVVKATGDLEVDAHHTVEDVGIVLGQVIAEALGDKGGIRRYGHALVPLDEALTEVALDVSGRPYLECNLDAGVESIGTFDPFLAIEFFRALVTSAGITLHVIQRAGANPHHILESAFKAVARALGDAVSLDARLAGAVPSTKDVL